MKAEEEEAAMCTDEARRGTRERKACLRLGAGSRGWLGPCYG